MNCLIIFLQIGDLFEGRFNWRGLVQLLLLIAMGAIAIGFTVFVGYKTFHTKRK